MDPRDASASKKLPNVQNERGGGVKGVLNNVKKTARLVKWGIPKQLGPTWSALLSLSISAQGSSPSSWPYLLPTRLTKSFLPCI